MGRESETAPSLRRPIRRVLVAALASAILAAGAEAGEVVAIVNPANAAREISLHRLRLLYGLYQRSWPGGVRVHILLPESGSPAMEYLVSTVFRMGREFELDRYYLQAVFGQRIAHGLPRLSPEETLARVRSDPGAIALIDRERIPEPSVVRILSISED